ncbi:MAG: glucosamine-6-phosphate deaminase [Anaerolineae bacterium]|nr:glucosamine-6-phosphate deaminase [Anaerolineae bacterium]
MITPLRTMQFGALRTSIYASNAALGQAAAEEARAIIAAAIRARGHANIILATGNSQLTFLHALREMTGIDWPAVNVFHMDEYVGIDPNHPASFPRFLRDHLLAAVRPGAFYPVPGQAADLAAACREYEALLKAHPADLCAMGIGENGHIAFNDPPFADFDDPVWVKVVKLDERSRRQQVGEGHFPNLDAVPTHAITLTIPALLAAQRILCIVPEARKAEAVERALLGPLSEDCPASILRQAGHAHLLLDQESAARLPW